MPGTVSHAFSLSCGRARVAHTRHLIEPSTRIVQLRCKLAAAGHLEGVLRSSPKTTNGPPRLLRIDRLYHAATLLQPSLHIFVAVTLNRPRQQA